MKSRFFIIAAFSLIFIAGIITPALSNPPTPTMGNLDIEPVPSLPCNNGNRYALGMQVHIQGRGFMPVSKVGSYITADFGHFETTLGKFNADEQGKLDAIITIPANTPLTGDARLQVVGRGASGVGRLLYTWIFPVASAVPNNPGDTTPDICGNGNTTSGIVGRVWLDANSNGIQDANENGLAGVTMFLDYDNTGVRKDNEPSAITDSTGHYAITGLQLGGNYTVAVDTATLPAGLKPTFDPDGVATPNINKSTVNAGWTSEHNDFGYAQKE